MFEFLRKLFDSDGFMLHNMCMLYETDPITAYIHLFSDLGIFIAYILIPLTLINIKKNFSKDFFINKYFIMFFLFILLCGITHFIDAITLFKVPIYRFEGFVKLITAIVSLYVAGSLLNSSEELSLFIEQDYKIKKGLQQVKDLQKENSKLKEKLEFYKNYKGQK